MRKGKFLPDWLDSSVVRIIVAAVLILALILGSIAFLKKDTDTGSVGQGLGAVVTAVQKGFSRAGDWIIRLFRGPYWDAEMVEEYRALKQEVSSLREDNLQMEQVEAENERLRALLDAKPLYADYDPIFARVVNRESTAYSSSFVIDAGSRDGIAVDMAVVSADGLVGRVTHCANSWATVECIISSEVNVPAMIEETRDPGIARGNMTDSDAQGLVSLAYLPDGAIVTPGDRVLTSGMGGVYPKGIVIGEVVSVDHAASGLNAVLVEPAADFVHLEEVFVISCNVDLSNDEEAAQ